MRLKKKEEEEEEEEEEEKKKEEEKEGSVLPIWSLVQVLGNPFGNSTAGRVKMKEEWWRKDEGEKEREKVRKREREKERDTETEMIVHIKVMGQEKTVPLLSYSCLPLNAVSFEGSEVR